jgi:hypothetical protein
MRRVAVLFALIALVSPVQMFTGRRFATVASHIGNTVKRVGRFLDRGMKMLPGGAACRAARREALGSTGFSL